MARATGYEPVQQTVTVVAGRERVVSPFVSPRPAPTSRGFLCAPTCPTATLSPSTARTTVLRLSRSSPPSSALIRSSFDAPGYREVRRTCSVGPVPQLRHLRGALSPMGVPVRIEANVSDAQLFVDGRAHWARCRGKVILPAGSHRIEVRADGLPHPHRAGSALEEGTSRSSDSGASSSPQSTAKEEDAGATEKRSRAPRIPLRNTVTHAGAPVPTGRGQPSTSRRVGPGLRRSIYAPGLTEFPRHRDLGRHLWSVDRRCGQHEGRAGRSATIFRSVGIFRSGVGAGPSQRDSGGQTSIRPTTSSST